MACRWGHRRSSYCRSVTIGTGQGRTGEAFLYVPGVETREMPPAPCFALA